MAVVAGGSEAALTPLSIAAFTSLQALSPTGISRPFDARRDGFVMGEGAGVLVLEDGEAARARGARILATVAGYGATSDAHHLTAPLEDGAGAARAIQLALRDAGRRPEQVVYVNAHGTSTPLNDRSETGAIRTALGDYAEQASRSRRRSRRSGICSAPPAPSRPSRRSSPCATVSPRRPSAGRSARRAWTSTTCPAPRGRSSSTATRRCSACRTRSASAATTPCWPWRPHDRALHTVEGEQLSALERLEVLCDPGSLDLVRTGVVSRRLGPKAVAGDGVLGASGQVDGRPIFAFAQDPAFIGGSLGAAHAETICTVLRLAGRARVPVIGFVASAGARMQEGLHALGGYGRIFREHVALSGLVPQISIVAGASAGGGSYAPALTDHVIMTRDAAMFLTGPGVVAEVMGEEVDAAALGGPRVHERNGVCHLVAGSDADAAWLARDLLDYLPAARRRAPRGLARGPAARALARRRAARARPPGLRRARRRAGHLRRRAHPRDRRALGAQRGRARTRGSTAARSASSPTSRGTWAACSTPRRPRRRRASCAPATRSGCRSSCSSTRRGSCPAPSRSRPASSATAPSSSTPSRARPSRGSRS